MFYIKCRQNEYVLCRHKICHYSLCFRDENSDHTVSHALRGPRKPNSREVFTITMMLRVSSSCPLLNDFPDLPPSLPVLKFPDTLSMLSTICSDRFLPGLTFYVSASPPSSQEAES